jgi:nitrate/nitrite transporter NarK
MSIAILLYILIGLAVGALARFTKKETSSLVGMLGTGGVAGGIGGFVGNLVFSDAIEIDAYGIVGSALLSIVTVLVVAVANRTDAEEEPTEAR